MGKLQTETACLHCLQLCKAREQIAKEDLIVREEDLRQEGSLSTTEIMCSITSDSLIITATTQTSITNITFNLEETWILKDQTFQKTVKLLFSKRWQTLSSKEQPSWIVNLRKS